MATFASPQKQITPSPVVSDQSRRPPQRTTELPSRIRPNVETNDPLSQVLRGLSLTGWRSGMVSLPASFRLEVTAGTNGFYLVRNGELECVFDWKLGSRRANRLTSGDVFFTLDGRPHLLTNGAACETKLFEEADLAGSDSCASMGANSSVTLIFAHYSSSFFGCHQGECDSLSTARIPNSPLSFLGDYASMCRLVEQEQANRSPGWKATVDEVVRLIFTRSLRELVGRASENSTSAEGQIAGLQTWLVASTDSLVGPAIGLIHAYPDRAWTVSGLANTVDMSRSAFSERFREIVGTPPMRYLNERRMAKACELLAESELPIGTVANAVGYDSVSSFSTRFKSWAGVNPTEFRVANGR